MSLLVVIAGSCGDETPAEEAARPATFGDMCMLGGLDICDDPFVCLEVPDFAAGASSNTICTVACQQTDDCPSWEEESRACASQCVRQLCRDTCR